MVLKQKLNDGSIGFGSCWESFEELRSMAGMFSTGSRIQNPFMLASHFNLIGLELCMEPGSPREGMNWKTLVF